MDIIESLKKSADLIVPNDLYLKCWAPSREILLPIIKINKGFIWQEHHVCDAPSPPPGPFTCETITEWVSIQGYQAEISQLHISKTPFQSPGTYVIQIEKLLQTDRYGHYIGSAYEGVAVETTEDAYNEQQSQLEQCAKHSIREIRNLWVGRGDDSRFMPNIVSYLYRAHSIAWRKWEVIERLMQIVESHADQLNKTSLIKAARQYFSDITQEDFVSPFIKHANTNHWSSPNPDELQEFKRLNRLFYDLRQALPESETQKALTTAYDAAFQLEQNALFEDNRRRRQARRDSKQPRE